MMRFNEVKLQMMALMSVFADKKIGKGWVAVWVTLLASFSMVAVGANETIATSKAVAADQATAAAESVASKVTESSTAVSAHAMVEQTTVDLLALIKEAQSYIDTDEEKFYTNLGELLRGYVDFPSFSRAVMGKYASSKRLASMDKEEQDKLNRQIDRFSQVFTGALINTYGKGLLVFEGEKIEVVPATPSDKERALTGKAKVKQLIYGDRDRPYEIYYSLRKNNDGGWKVRNMTIEASNLGKIYRNQFDNAYRVYEGDIDRVIDNWVTGNDS